MNSKEVKNLVERYLQGDTTLEEEKKLRSYFRREDIPAKLQSYAGQFCGHHGMSEMEARSEFDPFAKVDFSESKSLPLQGEKHRRRRGMSTRLRWSLQMAAGILLLAIGFAAGYFLDIDGSAPTSQVNPKLKQMNAALVNTFGNSQPSASERISAVNITDNIPATNRNLARQASQVLIFTMNNDESVNVRLAAAEALFKYRNDVPIKPALIHSLARQDDPIMQVTLIRMLIKLKAKEAVGEMQQLLVSTGTHKIVKQQLRAGIAQLQTS